MIMLIDNLRVKFIRTNKRIAYCPFPCAFDIETSSYYTNGEKRATMYIWTFGEGRKMELTHGRTWEEFVSFINRLHDTLELNKERRLVVYVHNLSYEFQFLCHWFTWEHVFATDSRKVLTALTTSGIEFRCSYLLSGYGLAKLGDELKDKSIKKKVGDLNYDILRNSKTPLTKKEMGYCDNDVLTVLQYVNEQIEDCGRITDVPLTKTGFVRRYCRKACYYDNDDKYNTKYHKYRKFIKSLTLEPSEYLELRRAFQGGFTHASAWYSGHINYDVTSYDFCSSYPAVLLSEMFPMTKGERIRIKGKEDFEKNIRLYCCLFDAEFTGLKSKGLVEHPLSKSRCTFADKHPELVTDNGRIVETGEGVKLYTTITEQDYLIYKQFYTWEHLRVSNFIRYKKDYLPKDLAWSIIKLYKDKTELKGVAGKEEEYQVSKGMLNSCYGMMVTDIVKDEQCFTGNTENPWTVEKADLEKSIEKYNRSANRFLFYPWGVWCTAYSRRNLFSGIYKCGEDYIYSDTDSIKILNAEKHKDYIDRYNTMIQKKLEIAMDYWGFPQDSIRPKTHKGVEKILGIWEYEKTYKVFKSLGAKRYLVMDDEYNLGITVAGLAKKPAEEYLKKTFGKYGAFYGFKNDLEVPPESTGKKLLTYVDTGFTEEVRDYLGNISVQTEKSFIHMENEAYHLGLSQDYFDYLDSITKGAILDEYETKIL